MHSFIYPWCFLFGTVCRSVRCLYIWRHPSGGGYCCAYGLSWRRWWVFNPGWTSKRHNSKTVSLLTVIITIGFTSFVCCEINTYRWLNWNLSLQLRDLKAVGNKFVHVMYPKKSSALLRDCEYYLAAWLPCANWPSEMWDEMFGSIKLIVVTISDL